MASDLPKEFDVVVLGTGMPESIVAAAFSRIGQSVLHLDRNEFYSGDWASFSLKSIEKWVDDHQTEIDKHSADKLTRPECDEQGLLEDGETLVQLPLYNTSFSQVHAKYSVREDEEESAETTEQSDKTVVTSEKDAEKDQLTDSTSSATTCDKTVTDQQTDIKDTKNEDSNQEDNIVDTVVEKVKEANFNDYTENDKSTSDNNKSEDKTVAEDSDIGGSKTDKDESESQSEAATQQEVQKKVEQQKQWTIKKLKAEWRKFNIDISPKLLFSAGDMVELLISSDIAKYCEFKTVTRILTVLNGKLEAVPCSRAGVFSSKTLSMLEKRMLMKFLQFCADFENKQEELGDFLEKPFVEFLESKKLSSTVRHYIQHSIAMATDTTTTQQGLVHMRKFLRSLGRYGNTAFLWSLYGSGELPQSFCRMCAVFGGMYCLRMSASSLIVDKENKCAGIVTTEGQRIQCKYLVMENSYAPESFLSVGNKRSISRAVIMTDKPLLPTGQVELSQMCLPCPDDAQRPVYLLELPPSSLSSPPGVYVFHLTRQGKEASSPQGDLDYAVNLLFQKDEEAEESSEDGRPRVLWSLYFSHEDTSHVQPSDLLPSNVTLMSGPGMEIDIDRTVTEARQVFQTILPEEEFLPKAPNPEDIVYVDDAETKVADESTQSDLVDGDNTTDDSKSETSKAKTDGAIEETRMETSNEEVDGATDDSKPGTCTEEVDNVTGDNKQETSKQEVDVAPSDSKPETSKEEADGVTDNRKGETGLKRTNDNEELS